MPIVSFFVEHLREIAQFLFRVYDSRRIVRCIDQDDFRSSRDRSFYFLYVEPESSFLRRHIDQYAAGMLHVNGVFREIRSGHDDLVALIEQRRHHRVQPACGACHHEDVPVREVDIEFLTVVLRYRLSDERISFRRCVAVQLKLRQFFGFFDDGFFHRRRCRDVRIADTEIVYAVFSESPREPVMRREERRHRLAALECIPHSF